MKQYCWCLLMTSLYVFLISCTDNSSSVEEWWDIKIIDSKSKKVIPVTLKLYVDHDETNGVISSFDTGEERLEDIEIKNSSIKAHGKISGKQFMIIGNFEGNFFEGTLTNEEGNQLSALGSKIQNDINYSPPVIDYTLQVTDLLDSEKNIDHSRLIANSSKAVYIRGERIYNSNCINCHGNQDMEGSIPTALKFWEGAFKAGSDPYSMYRTITRGYGAMPPQMAMTPQQKYEVICYIRKKFIKDKNGDQYFKVNPGYLAQLPQGSSTGPEAKPYHPWSDMDYGNFLINTYELVDEESGPKRFHSPGPAPFLDEDYLESNFAYKGIAIRLDQGTGGISNGNTFMAFDHDVMRVAGGWTGEGFIGVKFLTGIMRGRFNPGDQHLYACGMSAWGTTQSILGGGLYRIRYTGKPLTIPVALAAHQDGMKLTFPNELDKSTLAPNNFEVKTWEIVRSSKYGSDRYNIQTLKITNVEVSLDGKSVQLIIPEIEPVDIMSIYYNIRDAKRNPLKGTLQNTIHNLSVESPITAKNEVK